MFRSKVCIQPASNVSTSVFVAALNAAYQDYYIPVQLNQSQFDTLLVHESIQWQLSCVAVKGKRVIGTGMLGLRGTHAWVGGIGVAKKYRRRGIGQRIMKTLLEHARALDVETVQLEVITRNQPAIRLYESFGFRTRRHLSVLHCDAHCLQQHNKDGLFNIVTKDAQTLIDTMQRFQHEQLPWQRQVESPKFASNMTKALAIYDEQHVLQAGCLYRASKGQITILDLLGTNFPAQASLLRHLAGMYPKAKLTYVNVICDNQQYSRLLDIGFGEALRQNEMFLTL